MIYVNNEKLEVNKFPNGEVLINSQNLSVKDSNEIKINFESDEDITHLIFIKGYLDELKSMS